MRLIIMNHTLEILLRICTRIFDERCILQSIHTIIITKISFLIINKSSHTLEMVEVVINILLIRIIITKKFYE